jgi:hypothetical protein
MLEDLYQYIYFCTIPTFEKLARHDQMCVRLSPFRTNGKQVDGKKFLLRDMLCCFPTNSRTSLAVRKSGVSIFVGRQRPFKHLLSILSSIQQGNILVFLLLFEAAQGVPLCASDMPLTVSSNTISKCTFVPLPCTRRLTSSKDVQGNFNITSVEAGGDGGSSPSV